MAKEKKERYTKRLESLLFKPDKFISSIEKEKDYSKPLFFYIKIAVFSIILEIVLSLAILAVRKTLDSSAVNLLSSAIFSLVLAFALPFLLALIVHLGVLILRGKQGFFNTYKPIAYSLPITASYGILSLIIITILAVTIPASSPLLSGDPSNLDITQIFANKGFLISMIISLGISIISIIHSLYFQVKALSNFQKISKLRAFFSIILIPLVLLIIIVLIILLAAVTYTPTV